MKTKTKPPRSKERISGKPSYKIQQNMVNPDIIPHIKASTMAIVIMDESNPKVPLHVGGTGFLISEDGFLLTATHVLTELQQKLPEYLAKYPRAKIMCLGYKVVKTGMEGKIKVLLASFLKVINLKVSQPSNYQSSYDLDISVCRLHGDHHNLDFLELKKTNKLKTYDEIFMCGYPKNTLTIKQDPFGMTRNSPILQIGRIASIFPYDGTLEPEGIQTNMVGTGGSSGSPIIDVNDGKVIAIAQNVLGVNVFKSEIISDGKTNKLVTKNIGVGDTGLTYGITMFFVFHYILETIKIIKNEFYENGQLKSEFCKPPKNSQYRI